MQKKYILNLLLDVKNTTSSSQARFPTCVPTQFIVPNFYESGNDDINAFLNRDFSSYIGVAGYTTFTGDFDIGCNGSPVWNNTKKDPPASPYNIFYYIENTGFECYF
jgi:hypothetical protein